MAITYVNDLRLSEMDTGDNSGTWGTVTNTNLELIGEALGFGTEAITTNADTHASTIADGSTDPVRAMYVKYTGTLDSACTITIGPNTVNKFYYIENATSGSQNIIISQGSGANVTIPAGDVKAVYLDGAGSGAAVTDAFASLNVVDLKVQDDLTFSSDSAVISFGADADTTLTHTDGSGLTLNSTNKLMFNDASQFIQGSSATVLSIAATDEIDLTATAIDLNGTLDVSGTALVTGVLTTTAQAVFNGGFDGNAKATINTADGLSSDYALIVTNGEATAGQNFGMRVRGGSNASDVAFTVETYNNGTDLFRMYGNGQSSFHDGTAALPSITNIGDLNTGMYFPSADEIGLSTAGSIKMLMNTRGDTNFGGSTPETWSLGSALGVGNSANALWGEGDYAFHMLQNAYYNSGYKYTHTDEATQYLQADGLHYFKHAPSGTKDAALTFVENLNLSASGAIFNTDGVATLNFKVASDSNANMLFVDAENDSVKIGSTSGAAKLNVNIGITATDPQFADFRNTTSGQDARVMVATSANSSGDPYVKFDAGGSNMIVGLRWEGTTNNKLMLGAADRPSDTIKGIRINGNGDVAVSATDFFGTLASSDDGKLGHFLTKTGNHYIAISASSTGSETIIVNNIEGAGNSAGVLQYRTQNTVEGSLNGTSSGLAITNVSDYRKKENVADATGCLDKINGLRPVTYTHRSEYDSDTTTVHTGFIAHEVSDHLPSIVSGTKDAVDEDGNVALQSVAYADHEMITNLVGAIKELKAENDAMRSRLDALENA